MGLKSKVRKKILLKFVVFSAIMAFVFMFVNQCVRIKSKKEEIRKIHEQILVEKGKNEEILGILNEKESEGDQSDPDDMQDKLSEQVRVFENVVG